MSDLSQVAGEVPVAGAQLPSATASEALDVSPRPLPVIVCNKKHLRLITDEALEAIGQANSSPTIFQMGGQLVRIRTRNPDPEIEILTQDAARGCLARCANWVNAYAQADGAVKCVPVPPPLEIVRDILSLAHWPASLVPHLTAVVRSPAFMRDGELICTPGFHAKHGIYYSPDRDLVIPPVSATPTKDEVEEAKRLIFEDLVPDFPFVDDKGASKAHYVAMILAPFVRDMIGGPTPQFVVDAAKEGTGKTILAGAAITIFTGLPAATMAISKYDEETRKAITATVIAGATHLLFDNVSGLVESGVLANALTSPVWSDRILGESRLIRLPIRWLCILTGNNVQLSRELARRTLLIRLEPNSEKPWERKPESFRHYPLTEWVTQNRGRLIWSALTFIQNWIAQGKKPGPKTLGSFEDFSRIIGGILQAANIGGFLGNVTDFFDRADDTEDEWRAFVPVWWNEFRNDAKVSKELLRLARTQKMLPSVIAKTADKKELASQNKSFGRLLPQKIGACYSGFKILDAGKASRDGSRLYKLERLATGSTTIDLLTPEMRDWSQLCPVLWYAYEESSFTVDDVLVFAAQLGLFGEIIGDLSTETLRNGRNRRFNTLIYDEESGDELRLARRAAIQMEAELAKIANCTVGLFIVVQKSEIGAATYQLAIAPEGNPPKTRKHENRQRAEMGLSTITDEAIVHAARWMRYSFGGVGNPVIPFTVLLPCGLTSHEGNYLCDLCHVWWQLERDNALPDRRVVEIVRTWRLLPGVIGLGRGAKQKLRTLLARVVGYGLHPFRVADVTAWAMANTDEPNPKTRFYALEVTAEHFLPPPMALQPTHLSRSNESYAQDEDMDDMMGA